MTAVATQEFTSILAHGLPNGAVVSEDSLHDLALDQVFARVGADAPGATAAFRTLLSAPDDVAYRQNVFKGLEDPALFAAVKEFLHAMGQCTRADTEAKRSHYRFGPELWLLDAVIAYTSAVEAFGAALAVAVDKLPEPSAGWESLRDFVAAYVASAAFCAQRDSATAVQAQIADLDFMMLIRAGRVSVAPPDAEEDLREAVLDTFERFRRDGAQVHPAAAPVGGMDHVQAAILERVALVHPGPFERLGEFAASFRDYRSPTLATFADEVRFYLAYLEYLQPLKAAGLRTCFPNVSAESKELQVCATWDLALAPQLVDARRPVVTNDLLLEAGERILVISGPNQGGKTTTARTFGQLHHLAAIGCPVPGSDAAIFLCDNVLTVFEREESLDSLEGRFGAEVGRLHAIFDIATARSVLVINEAFASTALHDARILTADVLERISELDALAVCVTFIDELSRLNDKTVSMVSAVDADDPAVRTFRMERRVADGLAYARALAAKHGLTHDQIAARLGDDGSRREGKP